MARHYLIPKDVVEWLIGDDSGLSSRNIVCKYYGIKPNNYPNPYYTYPSDRDDFDRCYRVLKMFPQLNIEIMRDVSKTWAKLVENWPNLTNMHEFIDATHNDLNRKEAERKFFAQIQSCQVMDTNRRYI